MKVLLIEDNDETAEFIIRGLRESGHSVIREATAQKALLTATTQDHDVIIFDRMLPDMDGIDAVRVLRQSGNKIPIMLLTALTGIDDRVEGLDAGADDYMVKPFAFSELYARLKALLRRQPMVDEAIVLNVGPLQMNRAKQCVIRDEQILDLLPREYKILEFLMQNEGQLVTKTMLLEKIWGYSFNPKTSLVQTHVSRLRNKVDKPFDHDLIKTIRGSGYVISQE